MRNPTPEQRFADLLTRALDRIAYIESKKKMIVYDEIGYALGRSGGSAIQYWIYNHKIPSKMSEIETLVDIINSRKGWERWEEIEDFLVCGRHPNAERVAKNYMGKSPSVTDETDIPPSPFIVGPPVYEPIHFFGRVKETKRVFMALQGHTLQHCAVIGPSRSGKTSFLHYLQKITQTQRDFLRPGQKNDWLKLPERFQWVFVDFQDPRMWSVDGFFKHLLHSLNFMPPEEANISAYIDILAKRIHAPTVIMLDEIQAAFMIPALDQQFWWALRSLSTNLTEGKLSFIITSQKALPSIVLNDGQPSPFLNIFGHILHLGAFTEAEALDFLVSAPVDFTESELNWVLEKSQRWPALMQILCNLKYEIEIERGEVDWQSIGEERLLPYAHLLR